MNEWDSDKRFVWYVSIASKENNILSDLMVIFDDLINIGKIFDKKV